MSEISKDAASAAERMRRKTLRPRYRTTARRKSQTARPRIQHWLDFLRLENKKLGSQRSKRRLVRDAPLNADARRFADRAHRLELLRRVADDDMIHRLRRDLGRPDARCVYCGKPPHG